MFIFTFILINMPNCGRDSDRALWGVGWYSISMKSVRTTTGLTVVRSCWDLLNWESAGISITLVICSSILLSASRIIFLVAELWENLLELDVTDIQ